jgi:uncharacterized OsmC-like protein
LLYARQKGWQPPDVEVDVRHERVDGKDRIELRLALGGDLEAGQLERCRAVSGRCPVHRMLAGSVQIAEG